MHVKQELGGVHKFENMTLSPTWVPSPSVMSMAKKRMAQSGEMGSRATTSGYTINANPAPSGVETNETIDNHQSLTTTHLE